MVDVQISKVDGSSFSVNVPACGNIGTIKTAIAESDGTLPYQQQLLDMNDLIEVCSSLSEMEELRSTDQICTNGTTRKLQMVIKEISLYECLSKIAWEPITLAEEATEDQACSSKFNGKGWLRTQDPEAENNETWPMCENCNEALSLLLQLNLSDLPEAARQQQDYGTGLLQCFLCVGGGGGQDCDTFEPFSACSLVRVVPESDFAFGALSTPTRSFNSKLITGWEHANWQNGKLGHEWPNVEEYPDALRLALGGGQENEETIEEESTRMSDKLEEGEGEYEEEGPLNPCPRAQGDKLAGYADWVQGVEYPCCNKDGCGKAMQLVFQIDSDHNVPFTFGDNGCGHVTQCPEHKDVVTFAWACG
jgi:uncharacterized protein YwqG